MKVASFVISLISSLWMFAAGGMIFVIAFIASFLGAMFYDAPTADHEGIHEFFKMFFISLPVVIIAVAAFVLCIVGFVKRKKPKTYNILYGITCGITVIANSLAIPLTIWIYNMPGLNDVDFIFTWPVLGFIFAVAMIVLTVVNGICTKKKQIAVDAK